MRNSRGGARSPICRPLVASAMSMVGVVMVALIWPPVSVAQTRGEPVVEEALARQSLASEPSATDLNGLVSPLFKYGEVSRVAVSVGGGSVASVGEPGQLVYSNTRGRSVFGPSGDGGMRIADDIVTTAVAGCSLDRYVIRVTGDKDGSGDTRPFTVTVALYDVCPGTVALPLLPTPIANTECVASFVPTRAGELHDLECVIPADIDVPLPSTLYVAVTFDRGNAGWVVGAPAEQGLSADQFDFPGFSCAAALGGFPRFAHASFFTQIFVRDCSNAFPAYRNSRHSGSAFTPGRLIRFGDDITLSVDDCNMVAYEVSVKGTCSTCSGALLVDLKTGLSDSDPEAGNRIPGTHAMKFIFTNEVHVLHFDFDPPIPMPQSFFITLVTGSDVVGPIVTGRQADIGETADTFALYEGTAPSGEWVFRDFGASIWSAFDVTVFCEGDPPLGACCDTILTDDAGEAVCSELPEINCPNNRWLEASVCDPDPFTPACGAGACCRPDDACENLTLNQCNAVEPVERVRLWQRMEACETLQAPCPFNACMQREGRCGLVRSSPGCRNPFCCTDVCEVDPFCCSVEWDRVCVRQADELCSFPKIPTNGSCDGPTERSGALPVEATETIVMSNTGARLEEVEFFCENATPSTELLRTLWFQFEAVETSTRISTCGSDPTVEDTLIQVFRANDGSSRETACNSLEAIACNDDADVCDITTLSSVCVTGLAVGETYFVEVGGKHDSDVGVLQVDFRSPCALEQHVVNDDCRLAESIVTDTTPFDLAGATFDFPGPACIDTMVNDLWYEWTAPVSGLATISSCGAADEATPQTTLAVYEGCGCPVDEAAVLCGESDLSICPGGSRVQFQTSEGVCYKIRVIGASGGAPSGELSVKLSVCPVSPVQCLEEQKLTLAEAATNDRFGAPVSVKGDTAVVGASGEKCAGGDDGGSVFVFRWNGTSWVEEQKLGPSDEGRGFGRSVSVSEDAIVVGAWEDDCVGIPGSAYVFRFNGTTWVEEQKLVPSDGAHWFGRSVSLSGSTVVLGARGSAHVFRFDGTTWVEVQMLTASDADGFDRFGFPVSVTGDTVVVGAQQADCEAGEDCGSAYVFRFNGVSWVEEQKLTASDAGEHDLFGASLSVSGNTALVGAWRHGCSLGANCGAVYAFRFNGDSWIEEQKLTASDAGAFDRFGGSVSVSPDIAVVGAAGDDCAAGMDCGSAYVFQFNGTGWVEAQKLTASDAAAGDLFGGPLSVSGETTLVGATWNDCEAGNNCGSAYVFSCLPITTTVNLDIKPGSCPNSVNPRSRGVVPVAILGCSDFDVSMIDPDSLTLARADGVGDAVSPVTNRLGPKIDVEDVATPFEGERCGCHDFGGDGLDDLTLKFSTPQMTRAFGLNELSKGQTIELVLRGKLQDGTNFEARDCITIPGARRTSSELRRTRRSK